MPRTRICLVSCRLSVSHFVSMMVSFQQLTIDPKNSPQQSPFSFHAVIACNPWAPALTLVFIRLVSPPANRPMSRQNRSIPSVTILQIDANERARLKSFSSRATPNRQIIHFGFLTACHHLRRGSGPRCLADKRCSTSNKSSNETNAVVEIQTMDS